MKEKEEKSPNHLNHREKENISNFSTAKKCCHDFFLIILLCIRPYLFLSQGGTKFGANGLKA